MRLSAACKQAGIGVPINAIFKRRRTIWDPPPSLPEPTPEERKKLEKEAHDKQYNDWEKNMFKDLPSPKPFSLKKLLKQCAIQLMVMAGAMLYMKFYMQPKLEADLVKQMKILEQQRLAEFRANQTDFSVAGDGELEVIYERDILWDLLVENRVGSIKQKGKNLNYEPGLSRRLILSGRVLRAN